MGPGGARLVQQELVVFLHDLLRKILLLLVLLVLLVVVVVLLKMLNMVL